MNDAGVLSAAVKSMTPKKERAKKTPEEVAAEQSDILNKDPDYQKKYEERLEKLKKGEVPTKEDNDLFELERIRAINRAIEKDGYEEPNMARSLVHGLVEGDYEDDEDAFSLSTEPELADW